MRTPEELFAVLWSVYPRKVAKQAAFKAWMKRGPDEELLTNVLRALQWQMRGWSELQYVPHLSTYLNGYREQDENPAQRTVGAAQTIAQVLQQMGMRT